MSQIVDNLYFKMVNELKDLPASLQDRIYNHANKNNDSKLLAGLLNRHDLVKEIDGKLAENKSVAVRSAWISKPTRTKEELKTILKNEKRVTVIRTALGLSKLPKSLYNELLDRCGYNEALTIVADGSCEESVRLKALDVAFKKVKRESTEFGFDCNVLNPLERAINIDPDLGVKYIKQYPTNENLVAYAYSGGSLTCEEQETIVNKFLSVIDKNRIKAEGEDLSCHLDALTRAFSDMEEYSKKAINDLQALAKALIKNNKKSWVENRVKRILNTLESLSATSKNKNSEPRYSFKNVESIESFSNVVKLIEYQYRNRGWNYNRAYWGGLTRELLLSRFSTYEDVLNCEDWLDIEYARVDYSEVASEKVAALAFMTYEELDKVLARSKDAKLALTTFIKIIAAKESFSYYLERVLTSKNFDDSMLELIPATALLCLSESKLELIASLLSEKLTTPEAWNNFETIANDFTGSFTELLKISNKL